jgi:hypothetical protein
MHRSGAPGGEIPPGDLTFTSFDPTQADVRSPVSRASRPSGVPRLQHRFGLNAAGGRAGRWPVTLTVRSDFNHAAGSLKETAR